MAVSSLTRMTVPLASDQSSPTQGLLMPKLKWIGLDLQKFLFLKLQLLQQQQQPQQQYDHTCGAHCNTLNRN